MKQLALGALAALLLTPVSAAAQDPLLTRLAGDWIGRGTYLRNAEAEPELVYCRVSNTLANAGDTLSQSGRCAVASNSAAMEVTITAEGGGQYTGAGNGLGLGSRGQATLVGSGNASRLDLSAQLIDTATNRTAVANATIEVLQNGGYRLRVQQPASDAGPAFTASEVVFTSN